MIKIKPDVKVWKLDLVLVVLVAIGFEVIDASLQQLQSVPIYYDFIFTAKWLLMAGFAFHGLICWLLARNVKN